MGYDSMRGIIHELAAQLMEEYGFTTPAEINNGECGEFADLLMKALGEDSGAQLCIVPLSASIEHDLDGHVWVLHSGRHYDSETPDGVTDWRQLPFYKRNYARSFATDHKWRFFKLPLSLVPCPIVAELDAAYHKR